MTSCGALRSHDRGDESRRGAAAQLDAATFRTLLLLLYGAGLRFSEATGLTLADVDLSEDVLTIRATKFYKSRLFRSGRSLQRCWRATWLPRRRGGLRRARHPSFWRTAMARGSPAPFNRRSIACGVSPASTAREAGDEAHASMISRHSFAVHSLTAWYREPMCSGGCRCSPRISAMPTSKARRSI